MLWHFCLPKMYGKSTDICSQLISLQLMFH
jgi:hypothetical protein